MCVYDYSLSQFNEKMFKKKIALKCIKKILKVAKIYIGIFWSVYEIFTK